MASIFSAVGRQLQWGSDIHDQRVGKKASLKLLREVCSYRPTKLHACTDLTACHAYLRVSLASSSMSY